MSASRSSGRRPPLWTPFVLLAVIAAIGAPFLWRKKPSHFKEHKAAVLAFLPRAHLPGENYWSIIEEDDTEGFDLCRGSHAPAIIFRFKDGELYLCRSLQRVDTTWKKPPKSEEELIQFAESLFPQQPHRAVCSFGVGAPVGEPAPIEERTADVQLFGPNGSRPYCEVQVLLKTGQLLYARWDSMPDARQ